MTDKKEPLLDESKSGINPSTEQALSPLAQSKKYFGASNFLLSAVNLAQKSQKSNLFFTNP